MELYDLINVLSYWRSIFRVNTDPSFVLSFGVIVNIRAAFLRNIDK